jgi:hypothetical protein
MAMVGVSGTAMTVEQVVRRTAQHEVLHCAYASSCAMEVEWVRCRPRGQAQFCMPISLKSLYTRYTRHPVRTIAQLRHIAGVLLAPYVILDNIPRGVHPVAYAAGTDREQLEAWGDRWELYRAWTQPAGPTWRALCCDARFAVVCWYGDVGRRALVDMLADVLLECGMLDGHTWQRLVMYNISRHLKEKDKERRARLF